MKVYIQTMDGVKAYDSRDMPIGLVLSRIDRVQIQAMPVKAKDDPYILVKMPDDIPLTMSMEWLRKNIIEFKGGDG
jgi:hypothetical protein